MSSPKGWKVITYKDVESENKEESSIENKEEDKVNEEKCEKVKIERVRSGAFSSTDMTAKPFWLRNIFPVFLEAAFLILCYKNPRDLIYINFFFYLVLFFFYLITKGFSFRNLIRNWSSGSHFWKATGVCTLLFILAFALTTILGFIFPSLDTGFLPLIVSDNLTLVLFAVTTMFLSPIVEETFYRGNMICLESKRFRAISTFASIMLFAIIHSFSWWGILSSVIWAIPLTLIYIKTRNLYVTMTTHLIFNLLINVPVFISFLQ